jgi:hypothetical protein
LVEVSLEQAGISKQTEFLSWGDDILLMSNSVIDVENWLSVPAMQSLWKMGVDEDASFLSRHLPGGYSYFARMISRRVNREPAEEPLSILGCALSISAAWGTLKGHPLEHRFLETLTHISPLFEDPVRLVRNSSLNSLMRTYGQARSSIEPYEISRMQRDSSYEHDDFESLEGGSRYSERFKRELFASTTEAEVQATAKDYSIDQLLRIASGRGDRSP